MSKIMRRKDAGLTIIELLITLLIITILLMVGIPSYETMQDNARFSSGYNNLKSAYRIARAEAIKTSEPMVINAGGDGGTTWSDGWTVKNEDTDEIIFQATALKGDWIVSGSNSTTDGTDEIRFLGDGSFDTTSTGSLYIRNADSSTIKTICILRSAQSFTVESGSCL